MDDMSIHEVIRNNRLCYGNPLTEFIDYSCLSSEYRETNIRAYRKYLDGVYMSNPVLRLILGKRQYRKRLIRTTLMYNFLNKEGHGL